MEKIQVYKNRALGSLEGNWGKAAMVTFLLFFIAGGVGAAFDLVVVNGLSNVWTLLCLPLSWGFSVLFLHLSRKRPSNVERLFDGYKDFVRVFLLELLKGLATLGGLCLFVVPGIVVSLGFSMAEFLLADDEEVSAVDALRFSWQLTRGHKWQLFCLHLSFIGWAVLSLLTAGIGFLFLAPYMETTLAHFYEDLADENM